MALTWARNGLWALAVLLLGGAFAYGLLVGKPGPDAEAVPEAAPLGVDVVVASPETRSLAVETQGTVRPLREIDLVSQVAGKVVEVSPRFARGGFFAADELLVKIEDVDYRLQIARAESQVAAARQKLAEEEGRALQAQREWRDLGSDKANALFLRKPQIAAAQAALKASEADLEAARLDLARTQISAPFNGRISEKHVDLGQYVAPGSAIATVYDTNIVQVLLPLTDRQVTLLDLPLSYYDTDTPRESVGVPVELRARFASREWRWQGTIVRTDANIDESSRVVYAVAEVEHPFSREEDSERPPLSPGLFVNATISGRQLPDVVELPRSAMRPEGIVMVVDEDNRARSRQVRILDSDAEKVWVRGLESGERVIVTQAALVLAGMEVAPAEPESLTAGGA